MRKFWVAFALCALAGTVHAQGRSIRGAGAGGTDADATKVIGDTGAAYQFYVGADYQFMTLSVSKSKDVDGFSEGHAYGRVYDLRLGYRVFKGVGFEVHYGIDGGDDNRSDRFSFTRYYGVYIVPTATVFNTIELSLPIGYAFTGVKQRVSGEDEHRASINSAAFGANVELPLRQFSDSIPNLRLTGGGVVYVQRNNAQIYGFHAGLRYDFGFGSNSTPVSEASASAGAAAPEIVNTPGGGAPAGAAPAGGAPGGGAPAGGAPAGGSPGGVVPAGGIPGGGAPGGAAPAGGAPGTAAPAGGAPPL